MEEQIMRYEAETEKLYRQLAQERKRRREAEQMCSVYSSMASWGGVVMLMLSVILFYVAK